MDLVWPGLPFLIVLGNCQFGLVFSLINLYLVIYTTDCENFNSIRLSMAIATTSDGVVKFWVGLVWFGLVFSLFNLYLVIYATDCKTFN